MEEPKKENLQAFETLINQLREKLTPFLNDRKMSLDHAETFAFVQNLPFIMGSIAEGKDALKKHFHESHHYILASGLPDIVDYFEDTKGSLPVKKYCELIENEEKNILTNFAQYEDVLTDVFNHYCSATHNFDKIGIINKINFLRKENLTDDQITKSKQWEFLFKANIRIDQFRAENYGLNAEQWAKLYKLPWLVLYLVGSADQDIDKKEHKALEKFVKEESYNPNPLLANIFSEASKQVGKEKAQFTLGKHKEIIDELKEISELVDSKLSFFDAFEIKFAVLRLAYDIASSSGFWGFSFVAYQEGIRIEEIALAFGLTELDGKKLKFGKKVRYNKKDYKPDEFMKIFYGYYATYHLINSL